MKQEQITRILSEDGKVSLLCPSDTSLGALHDFLLSTKGEIVERINQAQKEEAAATAKLKEKEKKEADKKESPKE